MGSPRSCHGRGGRGQVRMGGSGFPGVDDRHAHGCEVGHVARDHRHAVHQRRRGDKCVAIRSPRIWNVQLPHQRFARWQRSSIGKDVVSPNVGSIRTAPAIPVRTSPCSDIVSFAGAGLPYSNSRIVMGDRNNVPACSDANSPKRDTFGYPPCRLLIFRNSETTFVSKIYITRNRTSTRSQARGDIGPSIARGTQTSMSATPGIANRLDDAGARPTLSVAIILDCQQDMRRHCPGR